MSTKAINIKLEEENLYELKEVAGALHMSMTDVIREALAEYLPKLKNDPFYRLTKNAEKASAAESQEILEAVHGLSANDLRIETVRRLEM